MNGSQYPWDPPTEGWVTKFINKNLWRVAPDYDFEDLFQEALLVYVRVQKKYPEATNLMPLFMRSFSNEINWLSTLRTRARDLTTAESDISDEFRIGNLARELPAVDGVEFAMLIRDVPEIGVLYENLVEGEFQPRPKRTKKSCRQSTNDFLAEVIGDKSPRARVIDWSRLLKSVLAVPSHARG